MALKNYKDNYSKYKVCIYGTAVASGTEYVVRNLPVDEIPEDTLRFPIKYVCKTSGRQSSSGVI